MDTKDSVYIALFAAIGAALGLFPPLTLSGIAVPITAQSMAPMLAGAILGARRGALAIALLLVLVALGLPLLAGGRGGIGVFLGPSAGFLFGWVVAAWVIGRLFERFWATLGMANGLTIVLFGGVVVLYACGIAWIAAIAKATLVQAATAMAVFLPGDLLKAVVATAVALTVRRAHPLIIARA